MEYALAARLAGRRDKRCPRSAQRPYSNLVAFGRGKQVICCTTRAFAALDGFVCSRSVAALASAGYRPATQLQYHALGTLFALVFSQILLETFSCMQISLDTINMKCGVACRETSGSAPGSRTGIGGVGPVMPCAELGTARHRIVDIRKASRWASIVV